METKLWKYTMDEENTLQAVITSANIEREDPEVGGVTIYMGTDSPSRDNGSDNCWFIYFNKEEWRKMLWYYFVTSNKPTWWNQLKYRLRDITNH